MHRSKLQLCVKVLCVLSNTGPINLRQIKRKTQVETNVLKNNLDFLVYRGLVEKQKCDYFVTKRGFSVLKVLGPLINEARRIEIENFSNVSNSLEKVSSILEKKRRWRLSDFIKIEVIEEL